MPYFKWIGYDTHESLLTGYKACSHINELYELLKQENIECIHARSVNTFFNKVTFNERQTIMYELSQLLHAHIRLSQALAIIISLVKKEYIRQVLTFCLRCVDQGKSFAHAAEKFPDVFDTLTVHALKAGNDSGFLAIACTERSAQLAEIATVRAKVRAACAMPLITGIFFIGVIIFLIMVILPQFKHIFNTLKTPLPPLTLVLIRCADMCTPLYISALGFLGGLILIFLFIFSRTLWGKKIYDACLLQVPVVSSVYKDFARAQILQSIALLMRSGETFSRSLMHVAESFNNVIIKDQLLSLYYEVQKGNSFSHAIRQCPLLAVPEIINSITISQEASQMVIIIKQLSTIFRGRALKLLDWITLLIQPLLLLLIGFFIGIILLALYIPLLQIPHAFN